MLAKVSLWPGWVQRVRKMGGMVFVDLRDEIWYPQLVFNEADNSGLLCGRAGKLGRECAFGLSAEVGETSGKSTNIPTGTLKEILVKELNILSERAKHRLSR